MQAMTLLNYYMKTVQKSDELWLRYQRVERGFTNIQHVEFSFASHRDHLKCCNTGHLRADIARNALGMSLKDLRFT